MTVSDRVRVRNVSVLSDRRYLVLELPIDSALAMISDGRIADAKTIMLLQYAALNIFR